MAGFRLLAYEHLEIGVWNKMLSTVNVLLFNICLILKTCGRRLTQYFESFGLVDLTLMINEIHESI